MLRQRFAEALRQGQIDGTLRTTFEPDAAAALVIAATDGLQTQFLLDPGIDMAAHISSLLDDLRVDLMTRQRWAPGADVTARARRRTRGGSRRRRGTRR